MTMIDIESAIAPTPSIATRVRWKWSAFTSRAVQKWRAGCDRLKWIGYREGNLERHARHELELAGWFDKDGFYGDMMGHAVMRMIREFSVEGHSGMSAPLALGLFEKVSMFEPLAPLTGEDDEWNEIADGTWQNKRCSHVFREIDVDGFHAYDIEGRIFRDRDGGTYTNLESRVTVTFPYTPKRVYVDVQPETDT